MTAKLAGMYDWFRDAGLPVTIGYVGWETYGRPYYFDPRASLAHHTASPQWSSPEANRNVVIKGNSVAPGPIAHVLLQRSIVLELIATGRCNHGGAGWWPLGQDTANMYGFAMECVNDGVGEYWQSEFVEVMARAYAVVHRELGIPVDLAWTHNAYAPTRKIDPAGPAAFRNDRPGTWTNQEWQALVNKYLAPPAIVYPPTEDDMKLINVVDERDGKLWIGDGLQRRHIPTWGTWDNLFWRATQGYGAPLYNPDGTVPNRRDAVARTTNPDVVESLGQVVA